ncbi:hypothetical protein JCM33374_g2751 [Metschnikowia sp. JCM 33374]|nr:hypothetical protein JCM33374_g2751 [Metschnikowia sp. JCM 33374]
MFKSAIRCYSKSSVPGVSSRISELINNQNLLKTTAYINGEWVSSPTTFEVRDPGKVPHKSAYLASVTTHATSDFNKAIEHAQDAFKKYRKTTPRQRADLLLKMFNLMSENKKDLATIISLENGKPYADALGEVTYAASFFQWFSEEAAHSTGEIISSSNPSNKILALRQPIGVCGIITPWNFPAAMITRKLAAALSVGCTAVIKPASETPLTALAIAQLAHEAGFDKGIVNVIPSSSSADAGKAICEHPLVKKVTFTGSTNVGKILMQQAASTLKKCSFELGGNAPFIVFDDANIDDAVAGVIASKFRSSGQTCICANRIFVHEKVYDEFAHKLVNSLKENTVLGHALEESTTHGPLIHEKSLDKVKQHVQDAQNLGAEVLFGGNPRPDLGDFYHDLTVLGHVTPAMQIFHEETFGPVSPLIKFSSDEEAVRLANETDVGLAGYFYTSNIRQGVQCCGRFGILGSTSLEVIAKRFLFVREAFSRGISCFDERFSTKSSKTTHFQIPIPAAVELDWHYRLIEVSTRIAVLNVTPMKNMFKFDGHFDAT